ncbi:MAG: hypothetical protein ABI867_23695 [Kofleriaceae bacterium]
MLFRLGMKKSKRIKRARDLTLRSSLASLLTAPADHPDDDCPLCRLMAGQEPSETIALPDGSILEIREVTPEVEAWMRANGN